MDRVILTRNTLPMMRLKKFLTIFKTAAYYSVKITTREEKKEFAWKGSKSNISRTQISRQICCHHSNQNLPSAVKELLGNSKPGMQKLVKW